MSRIAYVNGRYLPHGAAGVHVEDRGYQFSDGVYEVCEVRRGRLVDERLHLARLDRSLAELRIARPMTQAALGVVLREVVRRNRVTDGIVYLQVTRGVAPRDHAFPAGDVLPAVVVTARPIDQASRDRRAGEGVAVITLPDNRWPRVDIKTVSLLPNVLAKQQAREAGAFEAWFVDADGRVTEGTSSNAWIVTAKGAVVTRSADRGILRGVTRTVLLEALADEGLALQERPFSVAEATGAREAFLTSATAIVLPVTRIDGRKIGTGRVGPVAKRLRALHRTFAEEAPARSSPAAPQRSDK
jgi:D-alanine transaminase